MTSQVEASFRWPPAVEGHCATHCTCYRTNPRMPPRLPPNKYSRLLDFPAEILTDIALYLPYPSDAVSLSRAHPVFRNLLSEHNQLFWYKITRPHVGSPSTYKYDNTENYYKRIMDAFMLNNKDAKCQICCVKRAYKIWPGFKRRICKECFEDMTIDQVKIRFLGIPEFSYSLQKKYSGQTIHWACWKPDVVRAVEKKYPGENLENLLRSHDEEQRRKKAANEEYRVKTRQAVEARAIEIYKAEFQYLHPLVPVENFEDYVKSIKLSEIDRLTALVRPKKPVWIDVFARNHVLPVWKDILTLPSGVPMPVKYQVKRRIPSSIRDPVVTYHQDRFRSRGTTEFNWNDKGEPERTLLVGTCAICATTDLKEYVRRERQKLFPLGIGQEPDGTLVKERQWMTPQELMDHYEQHHTMEFYSVTENVSYNSCEAGKGGFWFWDGIPMGVEGLEQFLHVEKNSYAHRRNSRENSDPTCIPNDAGALMPITSVYPVNNISSDGNSITEGFESFDAPFDLWYSSSATTDFDSSNASCTVNISNTSRASVEPTSSPNLLCPYNSSPLASSSTSAVPRHPIKFLHAVIECSHESFKLFVKDKTLEWYRKLYGMTTWPGKDAVYWTSNPTNQTPLEYEQYEDDFDLERRGVRSLEKDQRCGFSDDDGDSDIVIGDFHGDSDEDGDDGDDDDGYTMLRATVTRILQASRASMLNSRIVFDESDVGDLEDEVGKSGGLVMRSMTQ